MNKSLHQQNEKNDIIFLLKQQVLCFLIEIPFRYLTSDYQLSAVLYNRDGVNHTTYNIFSPYQ